MSILIIDPNKMQIVKKCETLQQAEYWADILLPDSDYKMVEPIPKHFTSFEYEELLRLYARFDDRQLPRSTEYKDLLQRCLTFADEMEVDNTTIPVLNKKLGREPTKLELPKNPPGTEKPNKTSSVPARSSGPGNRPKEGTTTGRVWEIADNMPNASRSDIIEACINEGINKATASTQYGKWKKGVALNP